MQIGPFSATVAVPDTPEEERRQRVPGLREAPYAAATPRKLLGLLEGDVVGEIAVGRPAEVRLKRY